MCQVRLISVSDHTYQFQHVYRLGITNYWDVPSTINKRFWPYLLISTCVSAIRKSSGNLMVQNSVAFPQDGFDGKRVRWKWRHCFVFPQRFRWLKRVSSFPLRFRKRFCTEICWFSWSIPGFSYNKICFNCTDYASGKMRNHCIDLKYPKEQR